MTEHSISATLKAGRDFDSPWVVVYGDTPDEVEFKLKNLGGVLDATVQAAAELRTLQLATSELGATQVQAPAAPAQQPAGWQASPAQAQPSWSQPAPAAAAPAQPGVQYHPEGVKCPVDGNVVQFKQITSKASGKSFQLWTCPNQRSKGDGHYSEFAN